ncbi:MAG TPA: transglycosylase SLT domain-containing protein [Gemmatimonadaceae bacterium]|nr:transglycosylase SLT domain-containing protein [Gemmatimonadaceae bacterium]
MKRCWWWTIAVILLGACARGAAAPKTAPLPVPEQASPAVGAAASSQTSATVVVAGDTVASNRGAGSTTNDSVATPVPSQSDVAKRATEMFGDSADSNRAHAAADSNAEPTWDIDVHSYESTDRVEHYVRMFSGPAKDRIAARLERGTRYEPMIRAKMRAGGIPEDMYYLALIESGFDPNAYSRAAAVGMWQFMTSTARDMGMRVDWWVDERRDPVKSTTAAVRFIRELKDQLGSLYLAAAAYNGGPGRISRGLTRYADDLEGTAGEDLFFALADKDFLPRETRDYVPQLIAAALIAKDPQRYGMEIHTLPPYAYDSVKVGPSTPLAAVATASHATVDEIQELNPQILRGMTPPRVSMIVRVPVGHAAGFDSAYAALPAEARTAYRKVESKKGETTWTIAHRYGLTTKQVEALNPKLEKSRKTGRLVVGQIVLVPSRAVADAEVNVPDPAIERYSSGTRMHVVRRGENLSVIAKHYHTTVKSLMRLNGLHKAMIFPGQSLVVSGHARKARRRSGGESRPHSSH